MFLDPLNFHIFLKWGPYKMEKANLVQYDVYLWMLHIFYKKHFYLKHSAKTYNPGDTVKFYILIVLSPT